jgi:hypothetical protein
MHRPDECLLRPVSAANTWQARGRPAGFDDLRQLRPIPEAVRLVLGHGQHALPSSRRQESVQAEREGIIPAGFFEQPQSDKSIQKNGHRPLVALEPAGELRGR